MDPSTVFEKQPKKKQSVNSYPFQEVKDSLLGYFGQKSNQASALFSFYQKNKFEPVWITDSLINAAIQLITNAKFEGLDPEEYGLSLLKKLTVARKTNRNDLSVIFHLEVTLAKGVHLFANHLKTGKLNPTLYHPGWPDKPRQLENTDSILLSFIKKGKVAGIEQYFEPKYREYSLLKQQLGFYMNQPDKSASDDYPEYPGMILHEGDSNQFVGILKRKLGLIHNESLVFDRELEDSIKAFQRNHGLNPDGIPGKKTYEFLGWDNQRYIDALRVNLERMRWLPDSLPATAIYVNIAASNLKFFHNDSLIFESKVIVGSIKDQTPVYFSGINYLVFNPCWTVPNSIAIQKILPRLKTDSLYLQQHHMFVGFNGAEESIEGIDFSNYTAENFPYKIYQRTGSDNALGKVKFMFPNPYSIYLHDTPDKNLFKRDNRALSHGCVRVNNAMSLASMLLYKVDQHDKSIPYYLKKGYPVKVYLKTPVPVFILYQTCGVEHGKVIFYPDIYAKDYRVIVDLENNQN